MVATVLLTAMPRALVVVRLQPQLDKNLPRELDEHVLDLELPLDMAQPLLLADEPILAGLEIQRRR